MKCFFGYHDWDLLVTNLNAEELDLKSLNIQLMCSKCSVTDIKEGRAMWIPTTLPPDKDLRPVRS